MIKKIDHIAIAVRDLAKHYPTRDGPLTALDGVTFDVGEGEFVTVVGRSGCGKTTMLKILGGLVARSAGSVAVHGAEVVRPVRDAGIVFQAPTLIPWRSDLDNVLLVPHLGSGTTETKNSSFQQRYTLRGTGDLVDPRAGTYAASVTFLSSEDFAPFAVRWEIASGPAPVAGPLSLGDDLPFRPLDLTLRVPADWAPEFYREAVASILKRFIVRYRSLLAYGQHL